VPAVTFRPFNNSPGKTIDSGSRSGVALQQGRSFRWFAEQLLSQQIWCWGQDIIRPEGNWLLEQGFQRERPPADRPKCTSVYTLRMPADRCVVLRGFGVFWGDKRYGGVFLRRFEFKPLYSEASQLDCPPWSEEDMPELSASQQLDDRSRETLLLDLINWIGEYEAVVADKFGPEYRRANLQKWDNGRRLIIPAEDIPAAWAHVAITLSDHSAERDSAA